MRLKLGLLLVLLVSGFVMSAQSNYIPYQSRNRWIAGKFDSTLHVPSGATPSLRTGGYNYRGAIFFNTSDSSLYVYTGTQWRQLGADVYTPFDTVHVLGITKIIQRDTSSFFGIGTANPLTTFYVSGKDTVNVPLEIEWPKGSMLYNGSMNAFRVGYVPDSMMSNDSMGFHSIGIGSNAFATGEGSISISTALGSYRNKAQGNKSISIGSANTSYAQGSITIGFFNINTGAGVLIGKGNTTVDTVHGRPANIAYAIGEDNTSIGDGSLATGFRTRSMGQGSFSTGYYTEADTTYSHAMGNKISVRGYGSFGIGLYNGSYIGENQVDTIFRDSTMAIMGGNVGIGTVTPDSILTVERGIWGKRGVNFSGLPNGGASADSVLVVTSSGQVKKRNASSFSGSASIDTTYQPLITFTAGAGFAADTALITDSTIYGSFYTGQYEFTITKAVWIVKGNSGDTLDAKIVYNDTFNVDGTKINNANFNISNRFLGNSIDVSTNRTIPVNQWVWMKSPGIVSGKKPKYISCTLFGYKTYVAP